uniref:Thioredoxin domain-containing protein n=1 Tax=Rhizochromulina marina TaxID=1034831 RepID=A0A7S2SF83_9STRA|mmetsp:Transcript_2930/g.8359  ORF Transcript_2930/g.8359 Transcript_2930/m.8359 type:complete len:465 (+) Transcript_2930:167-1561(+)|eukprot:CAMPEP_0118988034 /NCGR_PEP_ID=MMETSP1173-20130426/45421_1 /TAXON_ID=1034831 /ORGANISM="Rhizochromulina marina cf, Strain CCMP1243" /LENGTH=464 /DNA_ID=CAMNT_0006938939 /DNA_START=138 /DNA_END=1532 /DNA_ORIENTATION=-
MGKGRGKGRSSGWFSKLDMFVKLDEELLHESTYFGSIVSVVCLVIMVLLMIMETGEFLNTSFQSKITIDDDAMSQIRINFNITMHDLSCDYATVDLLDVIGTQRQNVTADIEKWQLDENGRRRMYQGRNRKQYEVNHDHEQHPPLHVLHENGVHAVDVKTGTWESFTKDEEFSFVDFYAPWCIWCQRLHPTWEKFAEDMEGAGLPVRVAKVNCVEEPDLCRNQKIMAFPTLRFFHHGDPVTGGDYRSDRTTDALMDFAKRKLEMEDQYKKWPEARQAHKANWNPDHPGCLLVGHLLVNRVPGNFHIEARSVNHNLNAAATNLSHTVNHLSFGPELSPDKQRRLRRLGTSVPHQFSPLDGQGFIHQSLHRSFHHYLKVVKTTFALRRQFTAFQFLTFNQVMRYDESEVPEAKFQFDFSPMGLSVSRQGRYWYDYVTSLLSLVGGTFTVIGIIEGTIYHVLKPKKE